MIKLTAVIVTSKEAVNLPGISPGSVKLVLRALRGYIDILFIYFLIRTKPHTNFWFKKKKFLSQKNFLL